MLYCCHLVITKKLKKYTCVYFISPNMSNEITTLKIQKETKERLEKLREHKRETYDDLIRKILYILNQLRVDAAKAEEVLLRIDEIRKRELSDKKIRISKS